MSIFKKFKDSIKKINSQTEHFKKNHQMTNIAISKIIESLPKPFDAFLGVVWNGIQKDDNSLQEILKILTRIADNDELSFIQITSSIDTLIEKNASHDDIMKVAKQIKNSNTKIVTILDSKLHEISKISKEILDVGYKTRKEVKKLRTELKSEDNFRKNFTRRLKLVIKNLKTKNQPNYDSGSVNDLIDDVIKLFKERIEKWDVTSVKFATKELFDGLYKFSEAEMSAELYVVFKDLFSYAYLQRKRLIGTMIEEFYFIMLESWENSNNERAEKSAKILLRLGIDFLNIDIHVTEDCATAIDDLAEDLAKPQILSKEILLAAYIFEQSKSSASRELVKNMIQWIKVNHDYSNDSGSSTYLKDSIKYAQSEKQNYGINLKSFKQKLG